MSQNKYLKMKKLYDKTHVKPISKKSTARSNSTPYNFLILFSLLSKGNSRLQTPLNENLQSNIIENERISYINDNINEEIPVKPLTLSPVKTPSISVSSYSTESHNDRKWNTIMNYDEELYQKDLIKQLEKERREKELYKKALLQQMRENSERRKKMSPAECSKIRQSITNDYYKSLQEEEKEKLKQRQKAIKVRDEAMQIYYDKKLKDKLTNDDEDKYMMKTLEFDAEDYDLDQKREYLKKKVDEARYAVLKYLFNREI